MTPAGVSHNSHGKMWIFLSWLSLFLILAMMIILATLICANSIHALWPHRVEQVTLSDGSSFLGFSVNSDISPEGLPRKQYKVGNRELNSGADFRWVYEKDIASIEYPPDASVIDRTENGTLLGFIKTDMTMPDFLRRLKDYRQRWNTEAEPLRQKLASLGDDWRDTHLASLTSDYRMNNASNEAARTQWKIQLLSDRENEGAIKAESEILMSEFNTVRKAFSGETVPVQTREGQQITLALSSLVDVTQPNAMTMAGKVLRFGRNAWNLLSQYPREANTEGGVFPALFGTVMLVFLMAISAFPLGVAAGIYLREYAKNGLLSRTARVAVNNLAGVPSIVYGIFGLGFFVYGMGGSIDKLLYPERVAAGISTYGGGGIIWSSLTLGLLTLPVVIVATEEALTTIPSEVRQGSLALGATRFQTLWRVILPMASPGILTGFILAMARAAGEVAPLMLTGVVKSAHSLPLDTSWPFVHLERKFMHLGFHIYDMGFQSPNVEASKPLVYLTALVLLILVFVLNFAAIHIRKRMREKYAIKGF